MVFFKRKKYFLVLLVFLFLYTTKSFCSDEKDAISFIIENDTRGSAELLSKKSSIIKYQDPNTSFVLSLGNILGKTPIVKNDKGLFFLKNCNKAGIKYIIPAEEELFYGKEYLKILGEYTDLPDFLSANIIDEKTKEPVFTPYLKFTISNMKVCVIGITDPGIIKKIPDESIHGMEIADPSDAIKFLRKKIQKDNPDIIVVIGRMDRNTIEKITRIQRNINEIITTEDIDSATDKNKKLFYLNINGTPVCLASANPKSIGILNMKGLPDITSREFSEYETDDKTPHNPEIFSELSKVIEELRKRDYEDSVITSSGKIVTNTIKQIFKTDIVFLEQQSLFYYPVKDSINLFDVEKIVKPEVKLVSYSIKGNLLRSIISKCLYEKNPENRVHYTGITDDYKVGSIPIQNDNDYTVITTETLRKGDNGYEEFAAGDNIIRRDVDLRNSIENYLTIKDERIRESQKKKHWEAKLFLDIGSNLNKQDVNKEKVLYGSRIPKPFSDNKDQFSGYFSITSWNNTFTYAKNRHLYNTVLHMKYMRTGYRPEKESIIYKEAEDKLILYNKYTYNHPLFIVKPYLDMTCNSELYSGEGKHPVYITVSTGVTRQFPYLWNMVANLGLSADRNYVTNTNGAGAKGKVTFDKSFKENKIFTNAAKFYSETNVEYKPLARSHLAFSFQNDNRFTLQVWKKFNVSIHLNSYAYRDTTLRKLAIGFMYNFTLNYGMDWKI